MNMTKPPRVLSIRHRLTRGRFRAARARLTVIAVTSIGAIASIGVLGGWALLGGAPAAGAVGAAGAGAGGGPGRELIDRREVHFAELRQLTRGGQNAEAYWSPDGTQLIFQSTRPPYACDQIFRMPADGSGGPVLVSTGKGRTTCAYFTPDGQRVLFSSTHAAGDDCPPPADRSQGYVWAVYPTYEIWSARPDGSDLKRLTDNSAYDAETTVCPLDGSLVFTSDRDGDLELYRMDADGTNVKRLTRTPGYDGGAYFSPDCKKIVWRASRPQGEELEDYRRLLKQGLVRPGKLEIWTANADGSEPRQLTYLDAASFAPSFFPDGKRVIFASNYGDPRGREFELWTVNVDGTGLERITYSPGFDGFPMFSPDGSRLAFSSNRGQSRPGETNVFVARWAEHPALPAGPAGPAGREHAAADPAPGRAAVVTLTSALAAPPGPSAEVLEVAAPPDAEIAERFMAEVRWLADDAREGRGIGSAGLQASAAWLAERFHQLGLAPAGDEGGSYFQSFEVPVAIEVGEGTAVTIDGAPLPRAAFQPAGFSATAAVDGEVIAAGYGISAPELGQDDYRGVAAAGKVVVVRRFTPRRAAFDSADARRYGDLRYKAYTAREHGARGLMVVDLPEAESSPAGEAARRSAGPSAGAPLPEDAPLPRPAVDAAAAAGDAGIPVAVVTRAAGQRLFAPGSHHAALSVQVVRRTKPAANVVGVLRAGAPERLAGALLVGAHYDHLGLGGPGSLDPDSHQPHHGADDNASGIAALLETARLLAGERARLRRDVYLVAFSGEEEGLLGSTAFTRRPPGGLRLGELVAMLNMDMVGRLRDNRLSVLGAESAAEWSALVPPACARARIGCALGGDGYGPSDQSSFYAAGVPVLHLFTGSHDDYHKPSDTADKINAAGGARVALLMADIAGQLAARPARLTYKSAQAPAPGGDTRSYGASLGTIPDYAGDGRPGVLIGNVRPEGPAAKAGMERGDLLVELAGSPIRDIYDFMYVLQRSKPGETAKAVVDRGGRRLELTVTFSASQRR
ncbi:MAG TPA: M28 family peptidase [Thermoanaerobaculia bacterium]|nr:M28 family peptidase [Thermoanaerobaculia bacterium]